jgi:diheme cytochrome c
MMETIMNRKSFGALLTLLLMSLVVALGCAGGGRSLPTALQLPGPGQTPAQMQALARGRALAVTECAACHRFFWPDEYPPEDWPEIMERMAPLASLSPKQGKELTAYMVAASRQVRSQATKAAK